MSESTAPYSKYTYNGVPVPRVTEVISRMIHEEYLLKWANHLGFKHKSYTVERDYAANIGSMTHSRIEKILKGTYSEEQLVLDMNFIPIQSFRKWWEIVQKYNPKVLYSEEKFVCQYYGGTLDAVIEIGGKIYLIDFKTSNHVGYKYFLQLAAYRKMLRESTGLELDGVIILQLDKNIPAFEEYIMNFPEYKPFMDHCEETFQRLVEGYYGIQLVEKEFKEYLKSRG